MIDLRGLRKWTLLIFALSTHGLIAQVPRSEPILVEDWAPQITRIDPDGGYVALLGDVSVRIGDVRIRCDNLVVWLARNALEVGSEPKRDSAEGVGRYVREIYAEGDVFLRQGDEWIRAQQVYLDVVHDRGIVVDAAASHGVDRGRTRLRLNVRADELRILAQNSVEALGARITTCPFGHPHFHIAADRLRLTKESPGEGATSEGLGGRDTVRYRSEGAQFVLGETPILPFPDFFGTTGGADSFRYVDSVSYQHRSRFGHQPEIVFGDDLLSEDGGRWGHWTVLATYLSRRGAGVGVGLDYVGDDHRGQFLARYQHDEGEDRLFGEPPSENRGRISFHHRHQLPERIQLDLEFNLFSDRGFYPEYYEDEFKETKPPENLLFLRRPFFNSQISGTVAGRFNDFFDVTEQLPEVRYDLLTQPLFSLGSEPVYFTASARAGYLRWRPDENRDLDDGESLRTDLDLLLEHPIALGDLVLTPFAGVRSTWYEEDRRGDDRHRLGFTYGATLALQAHRVFDSKGGFFDLDGLRHVIQPSLTFRSVETSGAEPTDLVPFDAVERFDEGDSLTLSVRNLLQTRRLTESGPLVDTFLDLETSIAWHPDGGARFGEIWGNLDVDLLLRFSDQVQFASDFEVNWYGRGFEVFNASLAVVPTDDVRVFAGYRHFHETYDVVFAQWSWRVDEKWTLGIESAYDFGSGRGLDHSFVLTRVGHDWVLQIDANIDVGEDDFGIGVSIFPRLLFDPRMAPRTISREPRFQFLDRSLRH